MDQKQTGKFIAELRKKELMTQDALGQRLGVTNKTISRWETGTYMPDIEMLKLLADIFGVTMEELMAGHRFEGSPPSPTQPHKNPFSINEQKQYWKRKWRKDNRGLLIMLALIALAFIIVPFIIDRIHLIGLFPLVAFIEYGWQNNRMMSYVEGKIYDN